jgi:hypothetical protein
MPNLEVCLHSRPSKMYQIWDFGTHKYHLATLVETDLLILTSVVTVGWDPAR